MKTTNEALGEGGPDDDLRRLEERARAEIALMAYPNRDWVLPVAGPHGAHVHDVLIVGAGQAGLSVAFALKREGVANVAIIDARPAGQEGVWEDFARMPTLRTPKATIGLEAGIPSLSAPAWYRARYGMAAWNAIIRIERPRWAEFLRWFRSMTEPVVLNDTACVGYAPVRNERGQELIAVEVETRRPSVQTSPNAKSAPGAEHAASLSSASSASSASDGPERRTLHARRVVIASGYDGAGAWGIPRHIREAVSPERVSHANGPLDFARLAGQRIGLLGHAASAFDNAVALLEQGVASVDLCFRRPAMPLVNPHRAVEFAGFLQHFHSLPDDVRWQVGRHFELVAEPPTQNSYDRAHAHDNFRMHAGAPWTSVQEKDGAIAVSTPQGEFVFDHLVCATGSVVDFDARAELRPIGPLVQRWRHRYTPRQGDESEMLGEYPYLGAGFEYLPLDQEQHDWVRRIHAFNFSSVQSMGPHTTSSSGHKYAVPRLVDALTQAFMREQAEAVMPALRDYAFEELDPRPVAERRA